MQEIVCLYAKGEEVRYLSHLDLIRAWQRAVRRARLPVAHTQGALARPRIGFGPALGVGATSEAEHVVIELEEPLDPSVVHEELNAGLPSGLRVLRCWRTPAHRPRFAVGDLDISDYRIAISGALAPEDVAEKVESFLRSDSVVYQRRRGEQRRDLDLRPFVAQMAVESAEPGKAVLRLRLKASGGGCPSPYELAASLGWTGPEYGIEVHRAALVSSGTTGRAARRKTSRMIAPPSRRHR